MKSSGPRTLRQRARHFATRNSSALVITLAVVAILTVLLLAFLTRAGMERQIAGASAAETRADQIAKAGLDTIVADFRQEIAAGSTNTVNTTANSGWPAIYLPLSASTSVPARILIGAATASETNNFNLVRRSMTVSDFSATTNAAPLSTYFGLYGGAFPGSNLASSPNANTLNNPAVNGRSISVSRWNKPQLLNDPTHFIAPDWVLVTRNGPKAFTSWNASVKDATPANTNYVVGRYAYTVYDEGGLLDANVVGRPSGVPTPPVGKTAVPSLADLTQLTNAAPNWTASACVPSQAAVDQLVQWRNASTAASSSSDYNAGTPTLASTYFGFVTATTNSFRQVQPGDQTFLTRQDLINSITSTASGSLGAAGFTTNALPFLATFTRQVNAPSFYPALTNFKTTPVPTAATTNRPKVGDSGVANDTGRSTVTLNLDNQAYAAATDLINPALADIRFPTSGTLPDGTAVTAGSSMLRKRFALSRVTLFDTQLHPNQTNTKNDSTDLIYRYFGLYRSDATQPWIYDHGTGNGSIYTLQELQSAMANGTIQPRDPDFFELLQAAIAVGSLGRDAGAPMLSSTGVDDSTGTPAGVWGGPTSSTSAPWDQSISEHILQIGANIIDQASTAYDPMVIQDPGGIFQVYGAEDLPYISKVIQFIMQDSASGAANPTYGGWYLFELWNPYQINGHSGLGPYPTSFRVTGAAPPMKSSSGTVNQHTSTCYVNIKGSTGSNQYFSYPSTDFVANKAFLQFSVAQSVLQVPTVLDRSNTSLTFAADSNNPMNLPSFSAGSKLAGLYIGDVSNTGAGTAITSATTFTEGELRPGTSTSNIHNNSTQVQFNGVVSFTLEYLNSSNNWQPYNVLRDIYETKNPTVPTTSPTQFTQYYSDPTKAPALILYQKCDPRTDRWSLGVDLDRVNGGGSVATSTGSKMGYTFAWDPKGTPNGYSYYNSYGWPYMSTVIGAAAGCAGFPKSNSTPYWAFNQNNGVTGYTYLDPDGVYRRGDDMYSSTTGDTSALYGYSMNMTTATSPYISRSFVMHRPFQSVAELGYVFRDTDWKSLDFFTSTSGDSALLDVFSAYEEPAVVAGKVDINTRNIPVYAALFNNACIDELGSGSSKSGSISPSEALAFAKRIVAVTSSTPFHNKSDLVNRLLGAQTDTGSTPNTADLWGASFTANGSLVAAQQARIKTNRESALRSVSEATGSRTWNFLVDIIAQSGRYTSGSGGFADFTVEGEKRYWLHVAIDRYTGKIVDEQLEPIYE